MEPADAAVTLGYQNVLLKLGFAAVGLACIAMGYRLFVRGVFEGGAGVSGAGGTGEDGDGGPRFRFSMQRGGPGLVFALFGMAVVVAAILKPVSITYVDPSGKGEVGYFRSAVPERNVRPESAPMNPIQWPAGPLGPGQRGVSVQVSNQVDGSKSAFWPWNYTDKDGNTYQLQVVIDPNARTPESSPANDDDEL